MVTLSLLQSRGAGLTQWKVQFSVDGCWDNWAEKSSRWDEFALDQPKVLANVAEVFRDDFGMTDWVLSVFVDERVL